MAVIRCNLFSMNLKQNMECYVILPDKLEQKQKPLKAIWLYHGGSGDHTAWLYNTSISRYVNDKRFATVIPNVHESCFVDMNIGGKYGTYVGEELPKIIWSMFPIISSKREDNYVCGFSNGGYGCLHTALTYPEKYSAVGAFSAGDKADSDFENDNSPKSVSRIRLFGAGNLNENEYGLKFQAKQLLSAGKEMPRIYHACGSQDPWLDKNIIVKEFFESLGGKCDYTYDQIDGLGHVWEFWEEELVRFIKYLGM